MRGVVTIQTKIRAGIVGYGNIGRGAELALSKTGDMELTAFFTRRDPSELRTNSPNVPIHPLSDAEKFKDDIDVLFLCGGSSKDLPQQAPTLAKSFNIVDTYDNHTDIPKYIQSVNAAATATTAIISAGWDPCLFSMMRLMGDIFIPDGKNYTFWGRGVSQGHSEAIRRVNGVKGAIQYTMPNENALNAVRSGVNPILTKFDAHIRECYVVPENGADLKAIENDIKAIPYYFEGCNTVVHFISEDELARSHAAMPHGGYVMRSGKNQIFEFGMKCADNPTFTAQIMAAYARAAVRLCAEGSFGAKTAFDVPLSYLSPKSREELIGEWL